MFIDTTKVLMETSTRALLSDLDKYHELWPLPPKYFTIIQVVNGLISAVSSSIIAIANLSGEGLSTPFRRIIFGLSISDILQSICLIIGPLSVPQNIMKVSSLDEYENTLSCQANGFVLQMGVQAVVMYTFHLSLYYLCKLKYHMTDDTFKYKIERRIHTLIVVLSLAVAIWGLPNFTTSPMYRSFCYFYSDQLSYYYVAMHIIPATFLIMIILNMGLLCYHAFVVNRNIQLELQVCLPTRLRKTHTSASNNEEVHEDTIEENNVTPQDRLQRISKLYLRENMIQAVSYVLALLLTYSFYTATIFVRYSAVDAISIFFYPLGGFLNILVYTRPMVAELRRRYPECSRMRGFWLVLTVGGRIPDDTEISFTCCQVCCISLAGEDSDFDDTNTNRDGDQRRTTSLFTKLAQLGF